MATKKAKIPTSVEEAKLIIRSYMEHPVNWPVICEEVKANLHVLPEAVQKHYRETSVTKLRRRMNDQIQRYLLMEIEDVSEDLMEDVERLKVEDGRRRRSLSEKRPPQKRKAEATGPKKVSN